MRLVVIKIYRSYFKLVREKDNLEIKTEIHSVEILRIRNSRQKVNQILLLKAKICFDK